MTWYYASGGQQKGPVDDAQFEALVQSGQIQSSDLVWREGMANWQPLNSVRPAPLTPAPPPAAAGEASSATPAASGIPPVTSGGTSGDIACIECGGRFPRDQAIQYGSTWVCAACKPIFIQKLKEGVAGGGAGGTWGANRFPLGPTDPNQLEGFIRARGYQPSIGSCLSRAWQLIMANLGPSVGITAVIMICVIGMQFLTWLCCFLAIIPIVFQGPLLGGLFSYFIKLHREGSASMSDAFYPFTKGWLHLALFMLVSSVVMMALSIPGAGLKVAMDAGVIPLSWGLLITVHAILLVPMIYFGVAWGFSSFLILDRELDFWRAMELSRRVVGMHWWRVLWFIIVVALGLNILGALPFCLGLLITLPLSNAAMAIFYDDIFNDTAAPASAT